MGKIRSQRSLLIIIVMVLIATLSLVHGEDEINKKPKTTRNRHITRIPKPRPVFRGKEGLSIKEVLEPKKKETKTLSSVVVSRTSSIRVAVNNSNYTIDVDHLANKTTQSPILDVTPVPVPTVISITVENSPPSTQQETSPVDQSIVNVTDDPVHYIVQQTQFQEPTPTSPQLNSFSPILQVGGASFDSPQAAMVQTYNGNTPQFLIDQSIFQSIQQNNHNNLGLAPSPPPAHKFYRPGSWLPLSNLVSSDGTQFQFVQSTSSPPAESPQSPQILQISEVPSHLIGGIETGHPPPQPPPSSRPSQFVKGTPLRTPYPGVGGDNNGLRFYRQPLHRNSIMNMLTSYLRPYVSISEEEERRPQLFFN